METSKFSIIFAAALIAAGAAFSGGCKTESDFRGERREKTAEHFKQAKSREFIKGQVLTLDECMNFAVEHNLDVKVASLERDAAENMRLAEFLGMLPDITLSDSVNSRNNLPGSSSKAVVGDGANYGYSRSADKTINNFNIDFAFSLLDFGLAFFNTQQSHDKMLMKEKTIERVRQNLNLQVAKLYFQVAAAQRAMSITKDLLAQCRDRRELIEKLRKNGTIDPFLATEEQNKFLLMERRLENYIRTYENSRIELRALLGVYPTAEIKVDDTVLDSLPVFDLPNISLLEQIAILKRPELFEIDMQKHVNILECRKTILMMLPNVRLYMDFINNNNSFLMNQSWWELAVRAAYNALKTPQYIYRYKAYSEQVSLEELRSFVQAIAVMSQVRMAAADIVSARERYDLNARDYEIYREHLEKTEKSGAGKGARTQLELEHLRLTTAETKIERMMSLGACHIAYYRLLNALGVDNADAKTFEAIKAELAAASVRAADELEKARLEFEEKQNAIEEARIARILFDDAVKLYRDNRHLESVEYLRRASEKGSAEAMFCLGKMLWSGTGIAKDERKAAEYFIKAADNGKIEAMILAGWLYYKGDPLEKDLKLAKKYYRLAADQADERSFYWLGVISYDLHDYKDAMYYFKYAARGGDPGSMVWVGTLYRNGLGEKANYEKAIHWYERAAKKNNPDAMNCLYMMYTGGYGMAPDGEKAGEWLRKYEAAVSAGSAKL